MKSRKILIIDADVMQMASDIASYPANMKCVRFLENVREICHRIFISEKLRVQYDNHKTRFSSKWQVEMISKRKNLNEDNKPIIDIDELRKELLSLEIFTEEEKDKIEKDILLLGCALSTDKIIISNDDNILRKLVRACKESNYIASKIGKIHWINPTQESESSLKKWLKLGAKPDDSKMLINIKLYN